MKTLTQHELLEWTERFHYFNDGILKLWSADFTSADVILQVGIDVQDPQQSSSGWSTVTLRLLGCTSLRLVDGVKTSYRVLSNGLHILMQDNKIGLDFGDFVDAPVSLDELVSSKCHVVAERLEWSVTPIAS